MANDKPDKGKMTDKERIALLEAGLERANRAIQALLDASTEAAVTSAFTEEGQTALRNIQADDDWNPPH